jgi:hypothetical protein
MPLVAAAAAARWARNLQQSAASECSWPAATAAQVVGLAQQGMPAAAAPPVAQTPLDQRDKYSIPAA